MKIQTENESTKRLREETGKHRDGQSAICNANLRVVANFSQLFALSSTLASKQLCTTACLIKAQIWSKQDDELDTVCDSVQLTKTDTVKHLGGLFANLVALYGVLTKPLRPTITTTDPLVCHCLFSNVNRERKREKGQEEKAEREREENRKVCPIFSGCFKTIRSSFLQRGRLIDVSVSTL